MITSVKGKPYIIVTLDATKSLDRAKDAKRIFPGLLQKKRHQYDYSKYYLSSKNLNYKISSESETIFGPHKSNQCKFELAKLPL